MPSGRVMVAIGFDNLGVFLKAQYEKLALDADFL
jgi:hypothetical protein